MMNNANIPTRSQMIEMAKETRKKVTSAPVTAAELDAFPATVEKREIPTRSGPSQVYLTTAPGGAAQEAAPLVINLHGGGFIRERTPCDELFCRKLVHGTSCKVLDVDYRVAPEHPFPTGLYECYDVVRWAFAHPGELGVDPDRIFLCGHSAGGNFAVGISLLLEENNLKKPAAVIVDYPALDLVTDPGEKPVRGAGIPAERARLYNLYYCEKEQQAHYLASPVFAGDAQLKNFPKALFMTAELDGLSTECERFALRLAELGGEVTLKRFPGATHGFTIYKTPGCEEGVDLITRFINSVQ